MGIDNYLVEGYDDVRRKFLNEEKYWKTSFPIPQETLFIPPYYKDYEGNRAAQRILDEQTNATLYWSLMYRLHNKQEIEYALKTETFLLTWALNFNDVKNHEALLYMVYKGHKFLTAYDHITEYNWNRVPFQIWIDSIYKGLAEKLIKMPNNQGSWGWLGFIHSLVITERPLRPYLDKFVNHIKTNIDYNTGEMVLEVKRTNSGMWYSYFSLAPMLMTCAIFRRYLEEDLLLLIEPALDWLFKFCLNPDSWPHRPARGLLGKIQRLMYPCSNNLQIPMSFNWPGNMYEIASWLFYHKPEWEEWINPSRPLMQVGNIFRYSTLCRMFQIKAF